jgi:hypothetical protein
MKVFKLSASITLIVVIMAFSGVSFAAIPTTLSGLASADIIASLEKRALFGKEAAPVLLAFTMTDVNTAGAIQKSLQGTAAKNSRGHLKFMKKQADKINKKQKDRHNKNF